MNRRILALALPLLALASLFLLSPQQSDPEPFISDATSLADCTPGSIGCYRQAFGNVAYTAGAPAAFALLKERAATDRALYDACHTVTHTIGVATLTKVGGDPDRALVWSDPVCQSGFAHAIVEREILGVEDADPEAAAERLGSYCARTELWPRPVDQAECFHGMGHGLLIARDGDLPFALAACDAMTASLGYGWLRYCILGSFMELQAPIAAIDLRYRRDDDPVYPCDELEERYAVTCYGQYAARLQRDGLDQDEVARRCLDVTLAPGRIECLRTLLLVIDPRDETAGRIGAICVASAPHEPACLSGYIRGRADRSPDDPSFPSAICDRIAIDAETSGLRYLAPLCAAAIGYEYLAIEPVARCGALSIAALRERCLVASRDPGGAASFIETPID